MRFVLKAIFWFTIVLLFLPDDAIHKTEGTAATVDTAVTTSSVKASDVIAQVSKLCTQQPDVCDRAAEALSAIELDTEKGARLALELLLSAANDSNNRLEN